MIYANPVPAEMVSGEYYDHAGHGYYLIPAKLESDYASVRFERELHLFRRYCPRGEILDVGCSTGAFLYQLNQRFAGCYQVLGTDVSGPPLDYAESRGVAVCRNNFLETTFSDRKFDAVTFWAVLEHVLEPQKFVDQAWNLLKPGGVCFVLVPNMQSLAVQLLGSRYRYIYDQHLNYFTKATLGRLFSKKFTLLHWDSTHFNPIVMMQDWRQGGKEVSNEKRAELLQRTTNLKRNPLMRPVKVIYGFAEWMLARMNLADNLVAVVRRN
jgi:2-polyprenyl-3-methyl-5-hydroxy-6-metoxy-1,4-benzoquinol methylase